MPDRFGHYEFQNEFGLEKENSVNRCCFPAPSLFRRDNRSDVQNSSDSHDCSNLQNSSDSLNNSGPNDCSNLHNDPSLYDSSNLQNLLVMIRIIVLNEQPILTSNTN